MSTKLLGVDIFRVTTTPLHELGSETADVKGGQGVLSIQEFLFPNTSGVYVPQITIRVFDPHGVYRYVRANAANVAAGDGVQADLTANDADIPFAVIETAAANNICQGVTMAAIPSGSFGWIQVQGKHYDVNVADAVADDTFLDTAAGGAFAAAAADSLAQLRSLIMGVALQKIADRSSLIAGAVNRGICEISR